MSNLSIDFDYILSHFVLIVILNNIKLISFFEG